MFEDLRAQAEQSSFDDSESLESDELLNVPQRHFLGMTAPQRFLISFFLLLMVLVLGVFCLIATGNMVI